MRFYKKGMKRCIYEYTNYRYSLIENDFMYNPYTKNVMLSNIEKMFSLLKSGLIPVNEYMAIIADIENYTFDRTPETQIIENYCNVFNNSIVDIDNLIISTCEHNFEFETLKQLITFMQNELSLYSANTYGTTYIHETLK